MTGKKRTTVAATLDSYLPAPAEGGAQPDDHSRERKLDASNQGSADGTGPFDVYQDSVLELLVLLRTGVALPRKSKEWIEEHAAILEAKERIRDNLKAHLAEVRAKQDHLQVG